MGTTIPTREAIVTNAEISSSPDPQPETDLEYDLAHEWDAGPLHPEARRVNPSVYVATETADRDGDYGYDLAHDVPPR